MRLLLIVFFFIEIRVHADAVLDVAGDLIGPPAAQLTILETDKIKVVWQPERATTTRGVLHIERHVPQTFRMQLARGTTKADSTGPALVLPKDFMDGLVAFLWHTGDLRQRFEAQSFAAFSDLRESLTSFFLWPDLRRFKHDDRFAFDLEASAAPKLTAPSTRSAGGVSVALSAPLRLGQWATVERRFHPYVDFTGQLSAVLSAEIDGEHLRLHVAPETLDVAAKPRAEFPRAINSWIVTSPMVERALTVLDTFVLNVRLPAFAKYRARNIQQWQNSVRLPLSAL